jgi:NAD(P)H-quinone oxidoreductase subunit 5
LLRAEPLLAQSIVAQVLAGAAGLSTALYATALARVQTDVKSALAYAALTQVGIIIVEIALGLSTIAFVHIVGHACFRLLQLLAAPNVLHDLHELEDALGGRLRPREARAPSRLGRFVYLMALERGFLDAAVARFVVAPLRAVVAACDRFDRLLCGERGRSQ